MEPVQKLYINAFIVTKYINRLNTCSVYTLPTL